MKLDPQIETMQSANASFRSTSEFAWLGWVMAAVMAFMVVDIDVQVVWAQSNATVAIDEGQPPAPEVTLQTVEPIAARDVNDSPKAIDSEVVATDQLATVAQASEVTDADSTDVVESPVAAEIRNLTVEPDSRPLLPEDRPAWVGAPADTNGRNHLLFVGSFPTLHERDADDSLEEPLVAAVHKYIDEHVTHQAGSSWQLPVDAEFIRKNLIDDKDGYQCELSTSEGPMYQKWVVVRITPEQRSQFHKWHIEASQRNRLGPLGFGVAAAMALVGLTHVVLRGWHGVTSLPTLNQLAVDVPPESKPMGSRVLGFLLAISLVGLTGALFLVGVFTARSSVSHQPPKPVVVDFVPTPSPAPIVRELESFPAEPQGLFGDLEGPRTNGRVITIRNK